MEIMLCELEYNGENILENSEWNVITLGEHNHYRVFYKLKKDNNGFNFIAIEYCAGDMWYCDTEIRILFSGDARFDGVRHLWFGDKETETDPYWYYCENMQNQIDLFQCIQSLCKKYCNGLEENLEYSTGSTLTVCCDGLKEPLSISDEEFKGWLNQNKKFFEEMIELKKSLKE